MALRFPPVSQFLERFRALLRRRSRFDFDTEVAELTRLEQASAFLAVLELRRAGRARDRAGRAVRADPRRASCKGEQPSTRKDRCMDRPLRLIPARSARPARAHARGAARRRLGAAVARGARRRGGRRSGAGGGGAAARRRALRRGAQRDRARARRRRLGVPRRTRGGGRVRAPVRAAGAAEPLPGRARDARDRRVPRPVLAAGHRADPRRRGRLGRREPPRARPDRRGGSRPRRRAEPSAIARRRSSSAFSGSRASRSCRASTTSAATRPRSATACTRSPRSAPP